VNAADRGELHDLGEQMDFVSYLVAKAADPAPGAPTTPRGIDLHVPHAGLESLLRMWSARVFALTEARDAGTERRS